MTKEDTSDKIYHSVVTGHGSVRDVYNQAKEKDSSVTYNDVKQYLDKLNNRQVKFTNKNITHMCHRMFQKRSNVI